MTHARLIIFDAEGAMVAESDIRVNPGDEPVTIVVGPSAVTMTSQHEPRVTPAHSIPPNAHITWCRECIKGNHGECRNQKACRCAKAGH